MDAGIGVSICILKQQQKISHQTNIYALFKNPVTSNTYPEMHDT